jgi:hypothetical protein
MTENHYPLTAMCPYLFSNHKIIQISIFISARKASATKTKTVIARFFPLKISKVGRKENVIRVNRSSTF